MQIETSKKYCESLEMNVNNNNKIRIENEQEILFEKRIV